VNTSLSKQRLAVDLTHDQLYAHVGLTFSDIQLDTSEFDTSELELLNTKVDVLSVVMLISDKFLILLELGN